MDEGAIDRGLLAKLIENAGRELEIHGLLPITPLQLSAVDTCNGIFYLEICHFYEHLRFVFALNSEIREEIFHLLLILARQYLICLRGNHRITSSSNTIHTLSIALVDR